MACRRRTILHILSCSCELFFTTFSLPDNRNFKLSSDLVVGGFSSAILVSTSFRQNLCLARSSSSLRRLNLSPARSYPHIQVLISSKILLHSHALLLTPENHLSLPELPATSRRWLIVLYLLSMSYVSGLLPAGPPSTHRRLSTSLTVTKHSSSLIPTQIRWKRFTGVPLIGAFFSGSTFDSRRPISLPGNCSTIDVSSASPRFRTFWSLQANLVTTSTATSLSVSMSDELLTTTLRRRCNPLVTKLGQRSFQRVLWAWPIRFVVWALNDSISFLCPKSNNMLNFMTSHIRFVMPLMVCPLPRVKWFGSFLNCRDNENLISASSSIPECISMSSSPWERIVSISSSFEERSFSIVRLSLSVVIFPGLNLRNLIGFGSLATAPPTSSVRDFVPTLDLKSCLPPTASHRLYPSPSNVTILPIPSSSETIFWISQVVIGDRTPSFTSFSVPEELWLQCLLLYAFIGFSTARFISRPSCVLPFQGMGVPTLQAQDWKFKAARNLMYSMRQWLSWCLAIWQRRAICLFEWSTCVVELFIFMVFDPLALSFYYRYVSCCIKAWMSVFSFVNYNPWLSILLCKFTGFCSASPRGKFVFL
ncbi:hypothetical protein ISN44_As07g008920 [Arabidopsis suecica]|uniref:Uncharacterized protein n=1 Tax=Arabidopsis suecica TaxID=45249 RepID=A0A8T2BUD8_ARASU|nr:hypothetical protein ISN44_As07g008920 [Arabidopsis suecica]